MDFTEIVNNAKEAVGYDELAATCGELLYEVTEPSDQQNIFFILDSEKLILSYGDAIGSDFALYLPQSVNFYYV